MDLCTQIQNALKYDYWVLEKLLKKIVYNWKTIETLNLHVIDFHEIF